MANLENGLLKLVAAKGSAVVFPLGLVGVAAFWVWSARNRRREQSPRDVSGASNPSRGAASAIRPGAQTSYHAASGAASRRGTDRKALLSQILEENIRLREAIK